MKKLKMIVLVLCMLLVCDTKLQASTLPFKDVTSKNWYYDELETLYNRNIINGFTDGTFKGNSELKKDQLLKLLVTTVNPYADYSRSNNNEYIVGGISKHSIPWFAPYLNVCRKMYLEEAYNGEKEKIDENGNKKVYYEAEDISTKFNVSINRADVAKYTYKAYTLGKTLAVYDTLPDENTIRNTLQATYKDFSKIPQDAYEAIYVLYTCKIMEGDTLGNFNPLNSLTRAEATAITYRLMYARNDLIKNKRISFENIPGYVPSQDGLYEEGGDVIGVETQK